jgi:hypothetical protein
MTTRSRIVNPLWGKIQSIVFFLLFGYLSFLSGREYVEITLLKKSPRHPFGQIEKLLDNTNRSMQQDLYVDGVSYADFMLYLSIGCFLTGGIFVLAWFFDKAMKFAYLTLFVIVAYYVYTRYM